MLHLPGAPRGERGGSDLLGRGPVCALSHRTRVALEHDERGGARRRCCREQRHTGFAVWREPFSHLRWPKFFDLRADPFERGDESDIYYGKWSADRIFVLYPAQALVAQWLESFKDFPPRAKAASFSIDKVMEQLMPKS